MVCENLQRNRESTEIHNLNIGAYCKLHLQVTLITMILL